MKFQIAQTQIKKLSGNLYYMLLISLGLMLANILLAVLIGWSFLHQKRTIVPIGLTQSVTVSDSAVDANYLRQMALFFVTERLNITPSTIEQNQQLILQYTDPKFYRQLTSILQEEKASVIKQNLSSVFYPEVVIPKNNLTVIITGSLMRFVGNVALTTIKKNYELKFSYKFGNLRVLSFTELEKL